MSESIATVALILGTMAIVALIEVVIPLHARNRLHREHVRPNLALTFITFATNVFFNSGLVVALMKIEAVGFGLLQWLAVPAAWSLVAVVVVLDFSFYVCHRAMHAVPALWRFHRVHHSDPAVDVTTTIRQHPGEGVIRYAFLAAFALPLGASASAFAVYRVWLALNGLLEHANLRVPLWLDRGLSLITTWPSMHKVHHSRVARETDTNYGNILSVFDRAFSTFTPAERGRSVAYGLAECDDPELQTTVGLLSLPFSAPGQRRGEPSLMSPPPA